MSARLEWSGTEWHIEAHASLEEEAARGNWIHPVIRKLPERAAATWEQAVELFSGAVADLVKFDDVIPGATGKEPR